MTHAERAESLLEEATALPVASPARASYLAEAQVRAQLALVELVELAMRPRTLTIPTADVDPAELAKLVGRVQVIPTDPEPAQEAEPVKPAPRRRRAAPKKTTEAAT